MMCKKHLGCCSSRNVHLEMKNGEEFRHDDSDEGDKFLTKPKTLPLAPRVTTGKEKFASSAIKVKNKRMFRCVPVTSSVECCVASALIRPWSVRSQTTIEQL